MSFTAAPASSPIIPPLAPIATKVREPNDALLALLTKPEPLTDAEWRYVESLSAGEAYD